MTKRKDLSNLRLTIPGVEKEFSPVIIECAKEFVWYGVRDNEFFIFDQDIANMVMESLRGNPLPGVVKIEVNKTYNSGRMISECGDILEFVGEL